MRGRFTNGVRGDDGLTLRQEVNICARAIKMGDRWNITTEGRQKIVDVCMKAVAEPNINPLVSLKAATILVACEAMNQKDQLAERGLGEDRGAPNVIYVLPTNGTERIAG